MAALRALFIAVLASIAGLQDSGFAVRAEAAVGRSRLAGAKLGILIYSTKREAPLYEKDAKKVLRLASNTKLFTTACALAKLGPDYRFRTTLAWEEGAGDLHVFGAGDPLISGRLYHDDPTRLFRDAAAKLKAMGKTSFAGGLVVHSGIFDRVHLHPAWIAARYDQDAWWCAPVGGLSFNDNCLDITYAPGDRPGDPVKLTLRPDTRYVTIVNRANTVRSPEPAPFGFVRQDGTTRILVNGELAVGSKPRIAWVALPDPARYFGTVFKETLEREGIAIPGGVTESEAMRLEGKSSEFILAEHTLGDAVGSCNTVSQNLHAEMILKLLGFRFRAAGTTAAGLEVVREFLRTEVGVSDVELVDGSGLARDNKASAESLVKLLAFMRNHRHGKAFVGSLSVAGAKGTLKERMEGTAGRIHAKSGSLSGVSSLSGYAETPEGDTIIFSILANDWRSGSGSPRDLQDALGELMASWKAP
jgi:D-alanyl-D-alanine carboxypeptidase/D-alanyl-D-alanine-endopeptidase (penicillin-binding protein 4)